MYCYNPDLQSTKKIILNSCVCGLGSQCSKVESTKLSLPLLVGRQCLSVLPRVESTLHLSLVNYLNACSDSKLIQKFIFILQYKLFKFIFLDFKLCMSILSSYSTVIKKISHRKQNGLNSSRCKSNTHIQRLDQEPGVLSSVPSTGSLQNSHVPSDSNCSLNPHWVFQCR